VLSLKSPMQRMRVRIPLFLFALFAATHGHAQDIGTVTLLRDTPLRVLRGVSVLQGAEGMRLRPGDFLVTGSTATAQAQLELSGGAIVEIGPSSEVYLFSVTASGAEIVLARGWLKGEATSGSYRYSNPLVSAASKGGNVLLHADDNEADVFVEQGVAQVSGGSAPIPTAADKIFFTRRAGKPIAVAGRPSAEFVGAMPISFRDVLPPRLERFAGKKAPEPRNDHEVSFADVEPLLRLPVAWRRGLVERFRPRLQDQGFRQAIEAHIASLPEWKPVLYADNHTSGAAAPADKSGPR
jgi:hypothetical protein